MPMKMTNSSTPPPQVVSSHPRAEDVSCALPPRQIE